MVPGIQSIIQRREEGICEKLGLGIIVCKDVGHVTAGEQDGACAVRDWTEFPFFHQHPGDKV